MSVYARPVPPRRGGGTSRPEAGGSSEWVLGRCWLWCGNRHTWVVWLGPARTTGYHASFYACEPCVDRLHHTIIDYAEAMVDAPVDGEGIRVPLYVGASDPVRPPPITYRRGRHRRPRTALGRLWGRVVSGRESQPVRTVTAAKR